MSKETFAFLSSDQKTEVHAVRWVPNGSPVAVLQIAHGMAEYIERYEKFAEFLNERGILVTGNDHIGHGQSVTSREDWGYFAEKDGNRHVLEDLKKLQEITQEKYPDIPYFLLGHSMGSFLCRQAMAERGQELSGAVIMGTGNQPGALTAAGMLICRIIALFKGWRYRSPFVNNMASGTYNKKFGKEGGFDWLCTIPEHVKKYEEDPACGFMFTLNGFYNMFYSFNRLSRKDYISRMPKELPALIVSGEEDPVGDYGKGPKQVEETFRQLGMKDVTCRLYPGDRHEIHSEKDKETVNGDIANWILNRL